MRHVGLPRSGIKPVSPALAGGFFITEPPGKPRILMLLKAGGGEEKTQKETPF